MRQSGSGAGTQLQEINSSIQASSAGSYQVNNIEDSEPLYVGKQKIGGAWLVEKFVSSGAKTYANNSNNPSISSGDYSSAWAARATLTYGRFDEITGY